MTSEQVPLAQGRTPIEGDYLDLRCNRCCGLLEFHQPDTESPYKMLATCEQCESWYLLNVLAGWLLLLPDDRD